MLGRYHYTFSLAMFDIDHFKQVNDQKGHLHGDRVLQELSRLFDECIRDTDLVARYGGEEFVVLMPHTELAGASSFAERLRSQVAQRMAITVSGGVTVAQEDDTADSLLARADTALYAAKTAGRNRIFCHHAGGDAEPVAAEEAPEEAVWAVGSGQSKDYCEIVAKAASTASTARGMAASTAGVHRSPKVSVSAASIPTSRMWSFSGRQAPA